MSIFLVITIFILRRIVLNTIIQNYKIDGNIKNIIDYTLAIFKNWYLMMID